MKEIINKILTEWSYRVHDGMPNPNNALHLVKLKETLSEMKLPREVSLGLLKNLRQIQEKDIVKNKQSKNTYVVKKHNPDTQDLVSKDASDDEIEKVKKDGDVSTDDTSKKDTKNKELDANKNTSEDPAFADSKTGITDDEFKNQPEIKSNYENEEDELQVEQIEKFFESGKIPKRYAKVITRLMNSKKTSKVSITNMVKGVGAGEIQAQGGEIITMASIGMSDDEFEEFMNILESQVEKLPKGSKPIVTKEWLESARAVRIVTQKRLDNEHGKGNWSVSNSAWDTKEEFEALGNSDYETNKGFSSDMYLKLEVNGKPVLDEISLKKDSTANIYNGVVTDIKEWFGDEGVPDEANVEKYKEGELERPTTYASIAKPLNFDVEKLTSGDILNKENKALRTTLKAAGVIRKKKDGSWEIDPASEKTLKALNSIEIPPPLDRKRFKEAFGSGAVDRFKKAMIIHAAVNATSGDKDSLNFLNKQIGYVKDENGDFPEGSIKRYQNDTIKSLVKSETAKNGVLNALAEKLPLKSLMDGEENMAIGGLSSDKATLKEVFGVESFDELKTGLTISEDEDGNNYLTYSSKGPPAKEVKIAEVKVRQKGQGYASSVGLEFAIAKEFAQELYDANKELYPPEPEISDKEKRKLGVK